MVLLEPPTPCGRVEKKRIPPKKKFHQEPDHKGGIVNYLKDEIICDQVAQVRWKLKSVVGVSYQPNQQLPKTVKKTEGNSWPGSYIYTSLLEENMQIISAADGTPLITDKLKDAVGQYGSSQKADGILTGTFDSTGRLDY